jgi:tetratricopeptide (TPR) repeat protein
MQDRPGELAPGAMVAGRYVLERRLGVGGMASVWLALDERLGRPVAIKALAADKEPDREYRQRFRREAKLAARLQHPNLVAVYDYHAGESPYLVMEYVEGGTLAERLAAGDAPPIERLAAELLAALRCIHSAGILHRDVKPQNVLVDPTGRARLTDFGIAESRGASSITRTGIVIGTESYLAPERRRGEAASERSDLYSLGVLLAEVAERDGAGAAAWELIERLRAADPAARPSSAAAALAELERARAVRPGEATVPLPVDDPPEPPRDPAPIAAAASPDRRRRLAAGAIVAALIAVVLGVGLALGGGEDAGDGDGSANAGPKAAKAADGGGAASADGEASASGGAEPVADAPADGAALNDEGYALIQEGRYEEAIPVLQRAVDALAGSGDELTYNYALFNLAHALRLAGRPEEAIPLLEERLAYPDQQETVEAELAAAREAAGLEPDAGGETGGVKPEKGGPPAHAEAKGHEE